MTAPTSPKIDPETGRATYTWGRYQLVRDDPLWAQAQHTNALFIDGTECREILLEDLRQVSVPEEIGGEEPGDVYSGVWADGATWLVVSGLRGGRHEQLPRDVTVEIARVLIPEVTWREADPATTRAWELKTAFQMINWADSIRRLIEVASDSQSGGRLRLDSAVGGEGPIKQFTDAASALVTVEEVKEGARRKLEELGVTSQAMIELGSALARKKMDPRVLAAVIAE